MGEAREDLLQLFPHAILTRLISDDAAKYEKKKRKKKRKEEGMQEM
jgi:hypothetical protein